MFLTYFFTFYEKNAKTQEMSFEKVQILAPIGYIYMQMLTYYPR